MPIREFIDKKTGKKTLEKFAAHFLAETEVEATKLYKQYENIIQIIANRAKIITGLDIDDLISEGTIGLARANRDFENTRGATFRTFAIYKIKDAVREYANSQSTSISIPQYIRDARSLSASLKRIVSCYDNTMFDSWSLLDVWKASKSCEAEDTKLDEKLVRSVKDIRQKLVNLADRSCTSIEQLLERADLAPIKAVEIEDYNINSIPGKSVAPGDSITTEDITVEEIMTKKHIKKLKEFLSEKDYNLLFNHFGEGKTEREIAKELGIKASSVHVKIHEIIAKVKRIKSRAFGYEDNNNT